MQKQEEFFINSKFDFSGFLESGFLSDCELRIFYSENEFTSIRAHRYVISNSSDFFFNTFTSEMQEDITGIVHLRKNPDNMLPKVIHWMYDGRIQFEWDDLVPLLEIAQYYSIRKLYDDVMKLLDEKIDEKNILVLVRKCYALQFDNILSNVLEDYLALFFRKIPISELSEELDVFEFANVIRKVNMELEEKVNCISIFIGDYQTNDQEKNSLKRLFDKNTIGLKKIVQKNNVDWLPFSFLNSLK